MNEIKLYDEMVSFFEKATDIKISVISIFSLLFYHLILYYIFSECAISSFETLPKKMKKVDPAGQPIVICGFPCGR